MKKPLLPLLGLGLLLAAGPALAQAPSDSVLRDFLPIGDLLLKIEGVDVPDAEILRSDRAAAFLIIAPDFASPILLSPRRRAVERVDFMKVARDADGSADLLADAVLAPAGSFRLEGTDVVFEVGTQKARLTEKPPLLGPRAAGELAAHNPEYGRIRDAYQPQGEALRGLEQVGGGIEVRIFFGSWCPYCTKSIPKIMKVEGAMEEGRIDFAYYGLPREMSRDTEAKRYEILGVPTGVVLRRGKEIGRITGGGWKTPEVALRNILLSAPTG